MLLFAFACVPSGVCPEGGCEDAPGDTAGHLVGDPPSVAAPGEDEASEIVLTLELSDAMPTAVVATWSVPEGSTSWLEIDGREAVYGEGLSELVVLAPQDSAVSARVVAELDGERVTSAWSSVVTERFEAPIDVPVEVHDASRSWIAGELFQFVYEGDDRRAVGLVRGDGELIWYLDGSALGNTDPVSGQVSLDGRGMLVGMWQGRSGDLRLTLDEMEDNAIWLFGWDGHPILTLDTPRGHHLFDQPEPGVITWSSVEPVLREGDLLPVAFERLMVSEIGGSDWLAFDSTVLDYQEACENGGFYVDACDVHHANSMDCDLDGGSCLFNLKNTAQVLEVSIGGGVMDDFALWPTVDHLGRRVMGFQQAHDIHWGADGSLLVFNDGENGAWASRLLIDREAHTLTETWSYGREKCIQANALGTVQELDNGNYLVGFSTPNNVLREVTEGGDVVWESDLGGLDEGERCGLEQLEMVLGEARALSVQSLGSGVVVLD